jgi:hypothetical protein
LRLRSPRSAARGKTCAEEEDGAGVGEGEQERRLVEEVVVVRGPEFVFIFARVVWWSNVLVYGVEGEGILRVLELGV